VELREPQHVLCHVVAPSLGHYLLDASLTGSPIVVEDVLRVPLGVNGPALQDQGGFAL